MSALLDAGRIAGKWQSTKVVAARDLRTWDVQRGLKRRIVEYMADAGIHRKYRYPGITGSTSLASCTSDSCHPR
jgi:hypothetical protein